MSAEPIPNFNIPEELPANFHSDTRAFEVLAANGINRKGIAIIKGQIEQLSQAYRRPHDKLRDVLEGGALLTSQGQILLLQGMGGLARNCGGGECSEAVRSMTQQWAHSSLHKYLEKAELFPFYLEVAAPRLFGQTWEEGGRTRAGHTVLALGNPRDYVENNTDRSFIIIDPTLGVVQTMAGSSYQQTAYVAVPAIEKRTTVVTMHLQHEGEFAPQIPGVTSSIVLGINETADFVYTLAFKDCEGEVRPYIYVYGNDSSHAAYIDLLDNEIQILTPELAASPSGVEALLELQIVYSQTGLTIYQDPPYNQIALPTGGTAYDLHTAYNYPRTRQDRDYIAGLELAVGLCAATGAMYSLKIGG